MTSDGGTSDKQKTGAEWLLRNSDSSQARHLRVRLRRCKQDRKRNRRSVQLTNFQAGALRLRIRGLVGAAKKGMFVVDDSRDVPLNLRSLSPAP